MRIFNRRLLRPVAVTLLIGLTAEIAAPITAYALTSGPAQPEFSSFEPVATTNMVNEFTGGFTYNLPVLNIPGPNGSGYAMSLSYHSGVSPEEEASWVGYGWTLNPGAITRNKRGFPDDYKDATVKYWNKVTKNWTVSVGPKLNGELFSFDPVSVGLSASLRYNNYKGFGFGAGVNLSLKGIVSLGYSVDDGDGSFSYSVNPAAFLSQLNIVTKDHMKSSLVRGAMKGLEQIGQIATRYGMYSFSDNVRPMNITSYEGMSVNFSVAAMVTPWFLPAGPETGVVGNYTYQKNDPVDDLKAFGYMYSGHITNDAAIMDYYSEKESPYNKRDEFLSIPFSNADNFSLSGEGLSGGFRLYNKRPGHFRPNSRWSYTGIAQAALSFNVGPFNYGSGAHFGAGSQTLEVGKWWDGGSYKFAKSDEHDEPYFFRFNNDLGGTVNYAHPTTGVDRVARADAPVRASINDHLPSIDGSAIDPYLNSGKRSGRSSYIAYNTNSEMNTGSRRIVGWDAHTSFYRSHNKNEDVRSFVDYSELPDAVGEIAVTKEDGSRYVYGLPVYSRKEKNLQYGLLGLSGNQIKNNYIAYKHVTPKTNPEVMVGEERDYPYASTYLLTEIVTPDYIDRTNNGPTPDDLGGYTKFNYRRTAGSVLKKDATDGWGENDNSWYKWRIPYNGLLYNRGSLSDPKDDMGSMMSGEKEIYYLESIETKTHVAVFVCNDGAPGYNISGSGEERKDAYEAVHNDWNASGDPEATASRNGNAQGTNKMKRLEKIVLYAKQGAGLGEIVQTVRFDYDYSLSRGLPNSYHSPGSHKSEGKLTLRKVWFEGGGIVNAKISPYVFGYSYRTGSKYYLLPDAQINTTNGKYRSIITHGDAVSGQPHLENPDYNPFNIDAWGNYQHDGSSRHNRMMPWVDQHQAPSEGFDPAAWQLKSVRLPSGGEIHIQYEQNDYRYVQDRPAMAMVRLLQGSEDDVELPGALGYLGNKFLLDIGEDLGILTNDDKLKLVGLLRKMFVDTGERMYFRFLYALEGASPSLTSCTSEYITGYARVRDAGIDNSGNVYVRLGDDDNPQSVPKKVCRDLVASSKSGNLGFGGNCDPSSAGIQDNGSAEQLVMQLFGKIANILTGGSINCREISPEHSYLRVPLITAKKGGGVRVKRLLMFDKGMEWSDVALYGTEYLYQTEDGQSSGVATNEPSSIREENALVTYISKRREQSWLERAIAGRDKDQFEGPLGETLLPAPSIGYSRVVVKNIHTGKTGTGFIVNEFHTAKDYPFDGTYTPDIGSNLEAKPESTVERTGIDEGPNDGWLYLPLIIFNYSKANIWRTQGYRFVLNTMHGQPRRIASYGGRYEDPPANWPLTSLQEYEYFQPGEMVPMMYSRGDIRSEFPGKEMEVVCESRKVSDITMDVHVEGDASVGLLMPVPIFFVLPIPFASAMGYGSYSESEMHTHVTTKVIRYPAIQKSVLSFHDGAYTRINNLAFHPESGVPVLTETTDGHNGLLVPGGTHNRKYFAYSFMASRQYEAMGQKASNERTVLRSDPTTMTIDKCYVDGEHFLNFSFKTQQAACDFAGKFSPGDMVHVGPSEGPSRGSVGVFHVESVVGNRVYVLPVSFSYAYMAHEGVKVEIIRSGRTNQVNAQAGNITRYSATK